MIVIRKNPIHGRYIGMDIPVSPSQFKEWQDGALIQNAMPNISPDEREFILTGITSSQWNDMFSEEDE